MVLTPNIDMTLAVKAKEQYLIGNYPAALDTFRDVQGQIQRHITALEDELSHGDPANLAEVEKAYEEWNRCVELLQEEFSIIQQIQEAGKVFKNAPGAAAGGGHHHPSASVGGLSLSDAQLQAQHLAQQQATDIRDPDVWPPPTPQDPAVVAAAAAGVSRNKRQSSVGGNSNWGGAAPSAAAAAARPAPFVRTPMKPPQASSAADDDGSSGPLSNRLPSWASNGGGGVKAAPTSVNKPRVSRTPFDSAPRATPASAAASSSAAAASSSAAAPSASAVKERKPPIPTGGRKQPTLKAAAAKKPKDDAAIAAAVANPPTNEDGTPARVKFEANTKEEQEMAEMIEREILDKAPNVKMEDIAGLGGAKQLLNEAVVLPRLIPGYFTGKRKPWRGVLMFGPPGTGKTLLAKAVATECGTTFFNVSPSTVTSKYRGDSEKLMKLLFDMARFYAPSTIFMDEVDGLCSARGGGGEHEASRRVKGEILQQMDGATQGAYDPAKSVIVLGATNLPWELDTAFLRRFEKRVHIDLPDAAGRAQMFTINTEGMVVDDDVKDGGKWSAVVDMSEGYSGADIAVVCNDASMLGLRRLLQGKNAQEIKAMPKNSFTMPISRQDFETVFQTVKSSAGKNDLEKYREWSREYGSTI